MKVRVKIIEVGWGVDFDDNRHPRICIERDGWSAVLYDHPANGWEVVTLEIGQRSKRIARECHSDDAARRRLFELIAGEPVFDSLNKLEDDLYEIGCRGAMKRWLGKTATLSVEKSE
jgi:hypothetical protein